MLGKKKKKTNAARTWCLQQISVTFQSTMSLYTEGRFRPPAEFTMRAGNNELYGIFSLGAHLYYTTLFSLREEGRHNLANFNLAH